MAEYISKYKASKIDSILSEVENSIKPGLATLKTNSETSIKELQENKQENIEDIDSIRSGAALGATAIQKVKTINGISIEGEGDINILGSTSTGGTENVFADADCRKAFIDEMAFISQRGQGTVLLGFTINKDGSVSDVSILKSTNDLYIDKEAKRIFSALPKWKPAQKKRKNVPTNVRFPVRFSIKQ